MQRCNPWLTLETLIWSELGTLEWWISGLMLNPLFFLISRLNIACSPLILISRLIIRSGLRISHSKVPSSALGQPLRLSLGYIAKCFILINSLLIFMSKKCASHFCSEQPANKNNISNKQKHIIITYFHKFIYSYVTRLTY